MSGPVTAIDAAPAVPIAATQRAMCGGVGAWCFADHTGPADVIENSG
ncbi:MAG: hypothetical protein M3332_05435 [Actinomycetota bacterium]|nr:hypothetical protein [Actinomycetota bacterium]